MPLEDYADLQNDIQDYLEQEEVIDKIPTFIRLAEARMNRELSVRWMHKQRTGSIDSGIVALPADFIEVVAWRLTTTSRPETAERVTAEQFFNMPTSQAGVGSGHPRYYTIIGTDSYWSPNPTGVDSGTYNYSLEYLATIENLSATNTTNWLLTLAPDCYLYGALLEAMPYVIDDERMQTWATMYERAVKSLVAMDSRGKYRPGAVMRRR